MRTVLQKSHQNTHPRDVVSGKMVLPMRWNAFSGRRWYAGKGSSSRFSMNGLSGFRVIVPSFVLKVEPKTPLRFCLFCSLFRSSRKVASPSLRTTTSRLGHSFRAFSSQKLACDPPIMVMAFGWVSLAMVSICFAEL